MKKIVASLGAFGAGLAAFAEGGATYTPSTSATIPAADVTGFLSDVSNCVSGAMPVILSIAGAALGLVVVGLVWRGVTKFIGRK